MSGFATNLDKALANRDHQEKIAKEMKESLIVRKDKPVEGDHIFDIERKKMPEDTHNRVGLTQSASLPLERLQETVFTFGPWML